MNSKGYKWCMVPQCTNTSLKTPNKVFIYVPNDKTMRYKWLTLARRDPKAVSVDTSIYFCEDHFDLPNDMDNFMEYHIMGSVSKIRMKPGCIPTKFECQADRRKRASDITERPYAQKKLRQELIQESIKDLEDRSNIKKPLEFKETSFRSSDNQQDEIFPECSEALFTNIEHEQYQEDNDKENDVFPECSQSILRISKKRKMGPCTMTNSQNTNYNSDTSIEEIMDSEEDECKKKFEVRTFKDIPKSPIKNKSDPDCCAAKKYFNALFSKDLKTVLNTQDELPPIYAQFEHD
ncbi:hypothetical protein HF086_002329 [Spodoptera exigua]|uniref:THAP-type domain-containing protein n=1 Tax=Spodoptera exigua TaxID=7107 RepID=A0A922MT53_SPOEX|nr:hypothetical protein HF086_002329 [Spodoptera exigua]